MNDIDTFGAKTRGELFLAEGFLYGYPCFSYKKIRNLSENILN